VGDELKHADRRTDMPKVTGAFCDYRNVPKEETGRNRTIEGGIERKISSSEREKEGERERERKEINK
jgi:hypothetical protein